MARRNYLSQIINLIDLRFAIVWTRPKPCQRDDTSRHRFKNPFTMSKTATDVAYLPKQDPLSFHSLEYVEAWWSLSGSNR